MDFIDGLPRTRRGHDSVWVIVDRLTKSAHFLPVRSTYNVADLSQLFLKEIVRLHGVPVTIVSDRGTQFTSHFWKGLQNAFRTSLTYSTAFHPQTDGHRERELIRYWRTCCVHVSWISRRDGRTISI